MKQQICFLMRCTLLFGVIVFSKTSIGQDKVGIGTALPRAALHVRSQSDSSLFIIENQTGLNVNVRATQFFKIRQYYTGAIKSIGQSTQTARLSFFTFAASDSTLLRERLSILDNGNVGIGITNPSIKLDVDGRGRFTTATGTGGAVEGFHSLNNYFSPGIFGSAPLTGVMGSASTVNGIGVFGFNVNNGEGPFFEAGAGVGGFSNTGPGVSGVSGLAGKAGILGKAGKDGTIAGEFDALNGTYSNTLALVTKGPVRHTGIGEGAGKVFVSDANGNASWSQPIGFSAYLSNNYSPANNEVFTLGVMTEMFDYSNMFTNGASTFTITEPGLYLVSSHLLFATSNLSTLRVFSGFRINGNLAQKSESREMILIPENFGPTTHTVNNSRLLNLAAGDIISVEGSFSFSSGSVEIRGGNFAASTVLSAYKVR